ncbi:hypothetical protein JL721_409 [Aureococcus anophagefferens]|nr:hypothetical protein JL721_409 [Aureococcus anophagefferens]
MCVVVLQRASCARPLLLRTTSRALRRRCLSQRVEVLQRPAESGSSYTKFGDDKDDTWRVEKVEKRFNPVEPFLPAGFPTTVTPGYGTYAALQFAAYACSSACGVLSTRVLLAAVGVGDGAAAPLAAAANWAIKDGLGMLGGVAFAATWSNSLDARRAVAAPYFVPIAGLANVAKNVSYLAASASRAAIHQSLSARSDASNLADLTAKTGSQTIVASLCGLALGVAASNACGAEASDVWPAWAALSACHLGCTYASLKYVNTTTLDDARLAALVDAFRETGACPTPADVSERESLFLDGASSWLSFGDDVATCAASPAAFAALDDRGGFLLCPDGDRVRVLLYEDAAPADVLGRPCAAPRRRGGRPGGAAAFVAAIAGAGWRVHAPVAFDKGRLLRAPPAVADPGAARREKVFHMNAISAYLASATPSVGCLGDCTLDDDGPEAAAPSDEFRRLPPDDAPPPRETVFERMAFKTIYVQRARLKPDGFFALLSDATGVGDLARNAFGDALYALHCEAGDRRRGVAFKAAERAVKRVKLARETFERVVASSHFDGEFVTPDDFKRLLFGVVRRIYEEDARKDAVKLDFDHGFGDAMELLDKTGEGDESFRRYDSAGNGRIDVDEACAMALVVGGAFDAFIDASLAGGGGGTLTADDYNVALRKLGFGDVCRVFQGQFVEGVFRRIDNDGDGRIALPEFLVNAARLLRPVSFERAVSEAEGYPGWVPLGGASAEDINALVSTLQTGDVLLSRLDDDMGQFQRPGGGAFAASCLKCEGVLVLESTGEGIHVYDLAHRYFESAFSSRIRALAVRRVSVERTPYDAARAADFCRAVRGSLYSTVRDELKEAVSYHLADEAGAARRDAAAKDPSHFCSKVSYGFFQHMGWCDDERNPSTVMPSDFASNDASHRGVLNRDVALADGAHFLPLQVIWTPQLDAPLPWRPAKKAR